MTPQNRIPQRPVVAILSLVASFVVPIFVPEAFLPGLLGGLAGALLVAVWWRLFSRAPWFERLAAVLLLAPALAATKPLLQVSIETAGQGNRFYIFAIPLLSLAVAGDLLYTQSRAGPPPANGARGDRAPHSSRRTHLFRPPGWIPAIS